MAELHSLIRFKRHELDDKRKHLAVLNTQLEMLIATKRKMLDDLAREKNLASVDIEVARSFGPYLTKTLERCDAIDIDIGQKQQEVQAATIVVQEAYLEVKKLEVTQERRDQAEEDRIDRIESITLDDIGVEGFARRRDENAR